MMHQVNGVSEEMRFLPTHERWFRPKASTAQTEVSQSTSAGVSSGGPSYPARRRHRAREQLNSPGSDTLPSLLYEACFLCSRCQSISHMWFNTQPSVFMLGFLDIFSQHNYSLTNQESEKNWLLPSF